MVDGENGIVAGHGRVLAARKLGMTEVPCIEIATAVNARAGRLERKSVPQPPYPPSLKQEGYHGLQGRRLHRLIVAPLVSICRCSKPGKRSDIVASITLQIQGRL